MQLEVFQIPKSEVKLIPIASENLKTKFPSDIKSIKYGSVEYDVFDFFMYEKTDYFPRALFFLCNGIEVGPDKIWDKYKESNCIFLFVCKPKK